MNRPKKKKKRAPAPAPARVVVESTDSENIGGRLFWLSVGACLVLMARLGADQVLYRSLGAEEPGPSWVTACLGLMFVFFVLSLFLQEGRHQTPAIILQLLALLKFLLVFGWLLVWLEA